MSRKSIGRTFQYLFGKSFDLKTQVLIRVAIIGVLIGVVGVAFRLGTEKLTEFLHAHHYSREHWYDWLYFPVICTLGGLFASWVTQKFAPDAAGSGIPQVKYALNARKPVLMRFRTAVVKFFAAMAGIASGLSLGREGPTIQIGAGMGDKLAKMMGGKHRKRAIASGAGAGLAAAFNTPIAGVMFVIEELDHDFSSVSLGPAIVGSVCAAVTCRILYGDFFTFHFQTDTGINLSVLPLYIALGVIAGIFGIYFQKSIIWSLDFYKGLSAKIPPAYFGAIAGLITGLVALVLPEAIGGGHVTLEGTLAQTYIWKVIPLIFVAKYFLTVLAYGSGVPGGIFAPSLVLGALLGTSLGNLANYLLPAMDLNPATFAFIGMGAFFTAISRAPITSVVMLFELTGNYDLVLPLMLACIIANVAAEKLHNGSIYENLLSQQGLELSEYSTPSYLQRFSVEEAMVKDVETLNENLSLKECYETFDASDHTGFPVLNDKQELVGIVTKHDVHRAFDQQLSPELSIAAIMSKDLRILVPNDNLQTAILKLYEHNIGRLVVVDAVDNSKLVGLITRSDIISFEAYKELDH